LDSPTTPGAIVGRNVRAARAEQLLSQRELAERSGVAKITIATLELGKSARPRRRTVEKIADALDVPVEDLLSEEPIRPEAPTPPSQLSLNGLLQEERRGAIPEALLDYVKQRAGDRDREARDPDSPHFRTAAAAEAWINDLLAEMAGWTRWFFNHATVLLPPAEEASSQEYWDGIRDFAVRVVMGEFGPVLKYAGERADALESALDDLEQQRIARDAIAEVKAEMEAEASKHRRGASGGIA
jgi:transcriptional regulator with XRE-family HTH domain